MAHKTDLQGEELDPRAREVLREIVLQYTAGGDPISSRSLARCGRFELSPASLRNVMADLEDAGYVYQPHTSAGRIPTDRGYRFFINNLMKSRRLSQHEMETIDDQVRQVNEIDDVMQIASRILSKMSDQIGLAFIPTLHHLAMRSVDFILVADRKLLCVVVATNGVVVNKMIETPFSFSRDELQGISRFLSAEFSGLTLDVIHEQLLTLISHERATSDEAHRRGLALGIEAVEDARPSEKDLFVEGTSSILNKPEFANAETMKKTFLALQDKERLVEILKRCLTEDGIQILVGSESHFTRSYNFALVATRYGSSSSPAGMVGIIGPTRMEYGRVAPLVDYLGRALSKKIEETHQEQTS